MSGPYLQKRSWPPFSYQGVVYEFTHLNEYQIEVIDSAQVQRKIAVTFSDHCFTRKPWPGDDPALLYPASTRAPGYFCAERYRRSWDLAAHIAAAVTRKVWHLGHESYAIVPTVDSQGNRALYGIVFSLDPVTGLPIDLHMRVKSAHLRDDREIVTFGVVKFAHLVRLRMERKHPRRTMDRRRPRPQ